MKKLRKKIFRRNMADKQSTSGTRTRDVADDAVSRGAGRSEATTSSATGQLGKESKHAAVKEEILGIPDSSRREYRAMLSAAERKLCKDMEKTICGEGIGLSAQRGASKQTSEGTGEVKSEDERREQTKEDVEYLIEQSKLLANTRTHLELVIIALHEACLLSTLWLSDNEELRTLEASGEVLYDFLRNLEFATPPPVETCEQHLKEIKMFRKYVKEHESSSPKTSAKVVVRFYLCASVYQSKVLWHGHAQRSVEKARRILNKYFKANYENMTLFGQVCFLKAPDFFLFHHREALDSCLKQSFNAFISRTTVKTPSNAEIADLYSLPLDVYDYNSSMLTVNFSKHILSNLEARSRQFALTPSEKILNLATRIWISSEIGNISSKRSKKVQKALANIDLSIPSPELIKPMTGVLLNIIRSILLPKNIEFKIKLLGFVKDLCLMNKNLYIKFNLLHSLVLATIIQEDFYKENSCYLDFCLFFTREMEKETLHPDCEWMHEILSSTHLQLCYILSEAEDYDKCLEHAYRVIEVISGYEGPYRMHLEYQRSRAHYICAFSFHKKNDHINARLSSKKQVASLQIIQSHYPESLYEAQKHEAFLERVDKTRNVPKGLVKMRKSSPASSSYY